MDLEQRELTNIDIVKLYNQTYEEMRTKISDINQKNKRAMKVTLVLKLTVAIISIGAISSWLKSHGHKEIWAGILILGEIADVLLDNLPYFQQQITLPKMKIKLEHIELDVQKDLIKFERGEIDSTEAIRRYFMHRDRWTKSN